MIFPLVHDFAAALAALPDTHPRRRVLELLDEAIRRDVHFIDRHPTTLFQCLWNTCWWYGLPEAVEHYELPRGGALPWDEVDERLLVVLGSWREEKEERGTMRPWLRSMRPPPAPLGAAQRAILWGHHGHVLSVAFSPDGRRLVSGGDDRTTRVWDADTDAAFLVLDGHETAVWAVAFSSDGRRVLSRSTWEVRTWDAQTGEERARYAGHRAAWWRHGMRVAVGHADGTVRVFDTENDAELALLRKNNTQTEYHLYFAPDGRRLVCADRINPDIDYRDETIHVWDIDTARLLLVMEHVKSWSFSGERRLTIIGSRGGATRFVDIETGNELAAPEPEAPASTPAPERIWAHSADGRLIAFENPSDRDAIRIWDADAGREVAVLRGHEGQVNNVVFAPDGETLASVSEDGTVRRWRPRGGTSLPLLRGHARRITAAAFSPDGRRFATASVDHTARVWNAESGLETAVLRGHEAEVYGIAFSPDGRNVATASWDKTVRVWDARRGRELAVLRGHTGAVMNTAFSPDGGTIYSESWEDRTLRLWDATTWECQRVIPGAYAPEQFEPPPKFPLCAFVYDAETVVAREIDDPLRPSDASGRRIAWFPVAFHKLYGDPSGRRWAGFINRQVYFFELEGPLNALGG